MHTWDDGFYLTATCTSAGAVEYVCRTCGAVEIRNEDGGHRLSEWIYDDGAHYRKCLICGERFEEHSHTFTQWVPVSETESEAGEYEHQCSVCGFTVQQTFASNPNRDSKPIDVDPVPDLPVNITDNFDDKHDEQDDSENPNTGVEDIPKKALISAAISSVIGATILVWRRRKIKRGDEK